MNAIYETDRLIVRQFHPGDTEFILHLLNDDSFIRQIADKNVRTQEDAARYLSNGPISSYKTYGYGLYLILLKHEKTPIGMCGLVNREELDLPDLGYAFLPEFVGKGYAFEAAEIILKNDMHAHCLHTVLAITLPDNVKSNRLLKNLGFSLEGSMDLNGMINNLYELKR